MFLSSKYAEKSLAGPRSQPGPRRPQVVLVAQAAPITAQAVAHLGHEDPQAGKSRQDGAVATTSAVVSLASASHGQTVPSTGPGAEKTPCFR